MARPLHELQSDAQRAHGLGKDSMTITETELVVLKQYDMVIGTDDKRVAQAVDPSLLGMKLVVVEDGSL